ncbi:MAG: amino acid adenylation domain-containing protein, partial [bacterium]|nr:amino acid adenylation domain-containing protein [bacterium]
ETYWLNTYDGEIPVLELPVDFTRPAVQSYAGSTLDFEMGVETAAALKKIALQNKATLYMVLVAIFNTLLSKLTNREDIIIGAPVAGRRHRDLENIVGMFVNTLAIRNNPACEKTFAGFLEEVKEGTIKAFENQEYPFEQLVEKVAVTRDTSRNPLFDVMFTLQNLEITEKIIPGLKIKPLRFENKIAKFDLMLIAKENKDGLQYTLEYSTTLFEKETIERFIDYFKTTVSGVLEEPDSQLGEIEILSPREKEQLLNEFNDTETQYPIDKTIPRYVEQQAEKHPDRVAVKNQNKAITYKELNYRAILLERELREKGIETGTIAAIMIERSLDMIVGILGILKAGGAYLPIDPEHPLERIDYILKDSNAGLLLVDDKSEIIISKSETKLHDKKNNDKKSNDQNQVKEPVVLNLNNLEFKNDPELEYPASDLETKPSGVAYIIYTSGSTGKPKGVMVEHNNLTNFIYTFYRDYKENVGPADNCLSVTGMTFDVSVNEFFLPLYFGATLVILEKEKIMDVVQLSETIIRDAITYAYLHPTLLPAICENLETPGVKVELNKLLVGVESIKDHVLQSYLEINPNMIIVNGYGPTETTICATNYTFETQECTGGNVPIGKPLDNNRVYILERSGHPVPVGVPGELCVAGDGVARGYLNNPELTSEKFTKAGWQYAAAGRQEEKQSAKNEKEKIALPNNQYSITNNRYPLTGNTLYHTGDLARWRSDGNIEFLGRADHQVKIRGYRVELGEIGNRLIEKEDINEAVVLAREDKRGDKYLCAYIVARHPVQGAEVEKDTLSMDASELREYLTQFLPEYMIPSYYVNLEKLPLTANGKVHRKALPEPEIKSTTTYTAPRNALEEKLVTIWAGVLNINTRKAETEVGIDDNFFNVGGHSLKATILAAVIQKEFNVKLPLAQLFKAPRIREIAGYINDAVKEEFVAIEPVAKKEYYDLSSAQKRIYILQQMDENSTGYNMCETQLLEGAIDRGKLENTFRQLIARHESLRTTFQMIDGKSVQKVRKHREIEFSIEYYKTKYKKNNEENREHTREIIKTFIRPFDLTRAPLLRVGLIETGGTRPTATQNILMVDMHHIVSDGISIGIIVNDFSVLYSGGTLPPLKLQYKDYTQWQKSDKNREALKLQETYWLNTYDGEIPVLELPVDFTRPAVQSYEGSTMDFEMGAESTTALKTIAQQNKVTLYMILQAIFNTLLSKLTNREDIIIGTPVAGRRHRDLENIVGMFVNTLALRNNPACEKTFTGFLEEVKERTIKAFENQEYPFEELVEKVAVTRDTSRNPLFDVMFALQNIEVTEKKIPGITLKPYHHEKEVAKFDLMLITMEIENRLLFTFEYCTKLFKKETIKRFINYFKTTVAEVIEAPDRRLGEIEILSPREKEQLLNEFNQTETQYPKDKTIPRYFEQQAEKHPDSVAVKYQSNAITYKELNNKTARLARELRKKGVETGTIAAIMIERSLEMIVGILGILKAGGAYLPIDPGHPAERKKYMLDDSSANVLLTTGTLSETIPFDKEIIRLEETTEFKESEELKKIQAVSHRHPASGIAYIIYTSGSTGKPKGVMVEHNNLTNFIYTFYRDYKENVGPADNCLSVTEMTFDVSVNEFFLPLYFGSTLVILEKEKIMDVVQLAETIIKKAITYAYLHPTLLPTICDYLKTSGVNVQLNKLLVGVESIKDNVLQSYLELNPKMIVVNGYGPTETTICATNYTFETQECTGRNVPIGKPLDNNKVFILHRSGQLVPVGVPGEICVAGDGVARGYLNNPELTAEKFTKAGWQLAVGSRQEEKQRAKKEKEKIALPNNQYPITNNQLYHTGDLARWCSDGNIEFLGRVDH